LFNKVVKQQHYDHQKLCNKHDVKFWSNQKLRVDCLWAEPVLCPSSRRPMQSVEEEEHRRTAQQPDETPGSGATKKRKRSASMGKELTADQKAIVKMYVARVAEGCVKCCYCDKEITSRNVDRWASHLRGCGKTPEDIKVQIQPIRTAATSPSSSSGPSTPVRQTMKTDSAPAVVAAAPLATPAVPAVPAPVPAVAHTPNPKGNSHNEVFKVHVSKDYMKFNAAHFIAYKVWRGFWGIAWMRDFGLMALIAGIPREAARTQLPPGRHDHWTGGPGWLRGGLR
jgi:hypothetical protein